MSELKHARLLALLKEQGAYISNFWDLAEFTAFAVEFRYGALEATEEPLDRQAAIRQVQELMQVVKDGLEGQGG
jgi:hypothetical protein